MRNQTSIRRGSRKNPKSNKGAFRKKGPIPIPPGQTVTLTGIGRFAPDRLRTVLRYVDTTTSRGTTSNNAMNYNFRSSAFDPDSSLGSGAISGFTELANMYLSYRVLSMKLRLQVMNEEVTGVIFTCWPSNTAQNVNSLAAADVLEFSANVRAQSKMIPNANGGIGTLTCIARGVDLLGTQFLTSNIFASGTGGNPNTMYYINIGAMTTLGSNFTTHMSIRAVVEYEVEFFEVRQLES